MTIQQSNLESKMTVPAPAPSTFIPVKLPKRSGTTINFPAESTACMLSSDSRLPAKSLITFLARAFYWQKLLDGGVACSGSEIAMRENLDPSTVNELLRLTLLDPCIVEDIMSGNQPRRLTSLWFTRNPLPAEWQLQQILFEKLRDALDGNAVSGDVHDQA
jgi:hypothetical protein